MMHKSCKFQIKNGRFIPPTETVENLLMYNQQYNLIENNSELIVETDILIKPTNGQPKTVKHQTLIVLSEFNHKPFEIDNAVKALMFNLRHNIFDEIKLKLGINNEDYLLIYFPSDEQFSCTLNKDLVFENYDFKPIFNPQLLVDISY